MRDLVSRAMLHQRGAIGPESQRLEKKFTDSSEYGWCADNFLTILNLFLLFPHILL